jgi:hypothetical protein
MERAAGRVAARSAFRLGRSRRPYHRPVTLALAVILFAAALVALLPTRRLAERTGDRGILVAYYVAMWLLIAGVVLVPGVRRIGIPIALVLAIAPWVTLRDGVDRLLGRPPREVRRPPRNVTPPGADGTPPR